MVAEPCVFDFAKSFNLSFADQQAKLSPGADEPFYRAAKEISTEPAIIFSRNDYFSSALHELAHWSIAGEKRRKIDDYGYWYAPDGRDKAQQAEFFQVEIKPQALEWAFHLAANRVFTFSLDNLDNSVCTEQIKQFKNAVYQQLTDYFIAGFPTRALRIIQLLSSRYHYHQPIKIPEVSDV